MIMIAFVSFFLLLYALIRFLVPLHCCGTLTKICLGALFCCVTHKFKIYELTGNLFFAPELPRSLLLVIESAYAVLLLLVLLVFLRDIVLLFLYLAKCCGRAWQLPGSPDQQRMLLLGIAIVAGISGVFQAVRVPDVHKMEIVLARLPQELDGFSVVQLSDLHIGPILKKAWLTAVVQKTNALHPDVIAITGDFIDGSPRTLEAELQPLAELQAKHGVYGVTGNHEYYYGAHRWTPVFEKLGVTMLYNESRYMDSQNQSLVIAGIPDRTAQQYGDILPNPTWALQDIPEKTVRILLSHRPNIHDEDQQIDLQLSGHTHGGMIFFLKPLVAAFNSGFVSGLYNVGKKRLYICPGTGLWNGFCFRLGVPSEITQIILRSGQNKS